MPTHQQSFPRKRESNFTKTYNHGNLHEQLLLAGEVARADMPADQVSLREIARWAGVSHAAPNIILGSVKF